MAKQVNNTIVFTITSMSKYYLEGRSKFYILLFIIVFNNTILG